MPPNLFGGGCHRLEKHGIGVEKIQNMGWLSGIRKQGTGRIPWTKDEFGMYRLKVNDVELNNAQQ
jgi:hypothetical protein